MYILANSSRFMSISLFVNRRFYRGRMTLLFHNYYFYVKFVIYEYVMININFLTGNIIFIRLTLKLHVSPYVIKMHHLTWKEIWMQMYNVSDSLDGLIVVINEVVSTSRHSAMEIGSSQLLGSHFFSSCCLNCFVIKSTER